MRLEIFDVQGQKVKTLTAGFAGQGVYQVEWDGADASGKPVATGVYLARLQKGTASLSPQDAVAQIAMQRLNLPAAAFDIRQVEGKREILDPLRRKYVRLTPEEWVRQHLVQYLISDLGLPTRVDRH